LSDLEELLWQRVLDDFAAEERHRRFIEHCRDAGRLPEAAGRYRRYRDQASASDHAAIDRQLAAITAIALASLDHTPRERRHTGARLLPLAVLLFVLSLLLVAWALRL
jgi:hypothetical protein